MAALLAALPSVAAPSAYRPGVVLVGFNNSISEAQKPGIYGFAGAAEWKRIGVGVHVLRVAPGREQAVIQLLKAFNVARFAEPDYIHRASSAVIPNDTGFANQWSMLNTGQAVNGFFGVAGADIRATAAWQVTTGSNSVVIAVTDSGVQYTHPDLITNIWNNPGNIGGCPAGTHGYNVINSTCDPMDDESFFGGHGTHVTGIMAAAGNNSAGVAGLAWTTSILPVKWIGSDANGTTSDLISAIDWVIAAKQAGVNVRIVNNSATYEGTELSQALLDSIDLLSANDILFVSSSGNSTSNNDTVPRYPCSYNRPNQICAATTDMDDSLWIASNWGPTTVHLGAPGASILSTFRQSNYGYLTGGSMAAPLVSGTAALILSLGYQPVSSLKSMILSGVDADPFLTGKVATGGRLNVCKALPGCPSATTAIPVSVNAPVVTGNSVFGGIVGASTGIWSGLPSNFTYQWYRCGAGAGNCNPIPGATAQTYGIFDLLDSGARLAVSVAASNTSGGATAQSFPSAAVAGATSPLGLTSSIADGAVLSGTPQWIVTPSQSVAFVQFYIDGVLQQTQTLTPYTYNQGGSGVLDTSTLSLGRHILGGRALAGDNRTYAFFSAAVTIGSGSAPPVNTALPVITGTPSVGQTLTTSTGSWTNNPTNFTYQWQRCGSSGANCSPIAGATSASYVVAAADSGQTLRAAVTASNASGPATATSAAVAVAVAAPVNTTPPAISGTAAVGQTLTTTNGIWTNSPTSFTYQWQRCDASGANCSPIAGATSANYSVAAADSGQTLRAAVTASNTGGPATATSAAVSVAASQAPTVLTTSLSAGVQGTAYNVTLLASGGTQPYTWSISAGALPAGLTLAASTGVISGIPSAAGVSDFTVRVADANSLASTKALSITITGVTSGIGLVQSNAVEGTSQGSVSVAFAQNNTTGNLIVAFVRMSTTSQTVTMADSQGNTYTEAVSQAQSADGHQVHIFYARNILGGANRVTAIFSSTNNHPWLAVYEFRGLDTVSPLDQTGRAQGSNAGPNAGSVTIPANELIFTGSGFPNGWGGTVTGGTGVTGQQDTGTSRAVTATQVTGSAGTYPGSFTLNQSTGWTAVMATFRAPGAPQPPTITTLFLPGGSQNSAYSTTLAATGGTTPYTWSIVSGSLPTGLTLTGSTGVISGTPTAPGTSNFTVQLRDANSLSAVKALSITITAGPPPITLVQSRAVEGTAVSSVANTLAAAPAAGNLIIALVRMSTTSQTVQVTDSRGNTYNDAVSQGQTADGHQVHIFYVRNTVGGSGGFTVTARFSATNNHPWLAVYEYSGVGTLDATAHAQGTSASIAAPAATTTSANELLFAAAGFPNAWGGTATAGSGYALALQDTGTSRAVSETRVVSAAGSYSAGFTLNASADWTVVMATFK